MITVGQRALDLAIECGQIGRYTRRSEEIFPPASQAAASAFWHSPMQAFLRFLAGAANSEGVLAGIDCSLT
jgi:hypothetical protein